MVLADADEIGGTERAEIPDVATEADVVSEEEHRTAATVQRPIALVQAQHIAARVELGAHDADARQRIRTKADTALTTDGHAKQQVARRGKNAAAANVGLAVEVRAPCNIR